MTNLIYIYSLLGTGMLGGLLGVGLCVSAAIGNADEFVEDAHKMNFMIISAALSFSSAIYCLIVLFFFLFEIVTEIPDNFIWAAAALGGGSLLVALIRGLLTRSKIANGEWGFNKHIATLAGLEILVLPGLVYSLIVLFT